MAKGDFKGFLKSIGEFIATLFGLDKIKNSENGQNFQDAVNDIGKTCGFKRPVFQTKKEKAAAEKRAAEEQARVNAEIAQNTKAISETLKDISDLLGGGRL